MVQQLGAEGFEPSSNGRIEHLVANLHDQAAEQARHVLTALLAELPVAQSVRLATAITGQRRNVLYPLALALVQQPTEALKTGID